MLLAISVSDPIKTVRPDTLYILYYALFFSNLFRSIGIKELRKTPLFFMCFLTNEDMLSFRSVKLQLVLLIY